MSDLSLFLAIVGMALVTSIPRILPVTFLADRQLPLAIVRWLRFVPVAILSAMIAVEVLWRGDAIAASPSNGYVPAAVVSALVAWRKRSLFATVFAGMGMLALLRYFALSMG